MWPCFKNFLLKIPVQRRKENAELEYFPKNFCISSSRPSLQHSFEYFGLRRAFQVGNLMEFQKFTLLQVGVDHKKLFFKEISVCTMNFNIWHIKHYILYIIPNDAKFIQISSNLYSNKTVS